MFFQSLLSLLLTSTLHLGQGQDAQNSFDDRTLLEVSTVPVAEESITPPTQMSAESLLSVDLESQAILYEKDADKSRKIASLTKLMTAYIITQENDPSQIVTISQNAAGTGGSRMGLTAGEQITIKDLLYGLLIESGNDAAIALAETNAGTEQAFIEKMNSTAQKLGLTGTHYANTDGLDADNAYSTAHDLITLSTHLLKDNGIREIVRLSSAQIISVSGQVHKLTNTNILLGESGIEGLKTGTTPLAGECLISLARSPQGHEVLTVVLGSKHRFIDTKILVDWTYKAFNW